MSKVFERRMTAAVARIIKGVKFHSTQPELDLRSVFRVQDRVGPSWRSFWVTWWRNPDAERAIDVAGTLLKSFLPLNGVPRRQCSDQVRDVLDDLRHLNVVRWPEDEDTTTTRLWDQLKVDHQLLLSDFCAEAIRRCTALVAPSTLLTPIMPRLCGIELTVPEAEASLIPKDELANKNITQICVGLGPSPEIPASHHNQIEAMLKDCPHHYLATSHQTGTSEWCIEHGLSRVRSLLGIVAATAHHAGSDLGLTVIAPPPRELCLTRRNSGRDNLIFTSRDSVFPYLGYEIKIDDAFAWRVRDWHRRMRAHSEHMFERARKCSFFVNLGLCSTGTLSFIYFFIALDALFGRRHSVGRSIMQGVERCASELAPRIPKLYDLRNEIIHGGTSSVSQWHGTNEFEDEFGCMPDAAAREIALKCLLAFPD